MPELLPDSEAAAAFAGIEAGGARDLPPAAEETLHLFDSMREKLARYLASFSVPPPDAEEIIQETFIALFQHLQRGKSRRNLRGWMFRVAHNLALKQRSQARRALQNIDSSASAEVLAPDPGLNPEDQYVADQARRSMLRVVDALPEQDRLCLFLRAEGLRYREIAEVLDIALSSVSDSLGRSLARISRAAGR